MLLYFFKVVICLTKDELIKEKLSSLPLRPGVYLMKNSDGKIIYIGKSKLLKNRVSSYFQNSSSHSSKTKKLTEKIADFEIIVTNTETEALILENELIKRHNPKYNIKLKDAKTYPYIKVQNNDGFPVLSIAHKRKDKQSKYFGPYTSSIAAKDIIKTVQKTFRIPDCNKHFSYGKEVCRPCLNYHLDQCVAPCTGKISKEHYAEIFKEVELFLSGNIKSAKDSLEQKMLKASEELRFESAAKYRDRLNNLNRLSDKQNIVTMTKNELDVFGFCERPELSCMCVLSVRGGVVIDKNTIFLSADEISDNEALSDLILRYYDNFDIIPRKIFTSFDLGKETYSEISQTLSGLSGHSVEVIHPEKGDKKTLCNIALNNANQDITERLAVLSNNMNTLVEIATLLKLESLPERIESYDISNNGPNDTYAGMIVLEQGKFKKSAYRSFSIKTCYQNDYQAMSEAIERRIVHIGKDDDSSLDTLPDLILLDGGVGHVNTIKSVLEKNNIYIPIFGMVKDEFHKTRTLTDGISQISIAKNQALFSFFYRVQEEVHRFTFSKMDTSRTKKIKSSSLTEINGIGKEKSKLLLKHFKSITNIKNATLEELYAINGISKANARSIIEHFKNQE